MTRYDFRTPRLHVGDRLRSGARLELGPMQSHYLRDVLRLKSGNKVLVFNGLDGEWEARLEAVGSRSAALFVEQQMRPQPAAGDLHYLFAPLKRGRLYYMVQKAVEMGVGRLQPVITRHTQPERVNTARMRANVVEAAEQCGILTVPEVDEPVPLDRALPGLESGRLLIFCDEESPIVDPIAALADARSAAGSRPLALLVGPEGGFHADERELVLARGGVVRLSLGPRILRADTAAVAALALVQAMLGDWR